MKILIIEDDEFFRKFYSAKLAENGLEIVDANNGEEGLEKAKEHKPSIILLDLIMPVKDGFQVLQELKAIPEIKSIPVLVFSTLGTESDVEKAKQLGAVDFINKSYFDLPTLLSKIHQYTS